MLHAFSENGTGDIDVQMNHLIERVVLMQERADVCAVKSVHSG